MRRTALLVLLFLSTWPPVSSAMDCVDYREYLHRVGSIALEEEANQVVLVDNYAIVSVQSGLRVIDITHPRGMVPVGGFDWESFTVKAMEVGSGYLYVVGTDYQTGSQDMICTFDISDISSPVPVGSVELGRYPNTLAVANDYLYVTVHDRLCIYDLSDPTSPQLVTEYFEQCAHDPEGIVIEENRAYITNGASGLLILDVSNPEQPHYLGSANEAYGYTRDLCLTGGYAYAASAEGGVTVFDISDPHAPFPCAHVQLPSFCYYVGACGHYVYAAASGDSDSGLWVIDASNGADPRIVNYTALSAYPHDFAFHGDHVFVASYHHYRGSFLEAMDIGVPESAPGAQELDLGPGMSPAIAFREPILVWAQYQSQRCIRSARISSSLPMPQPVARLPITGRPSAMTFCGNYVFVSTGYEFTGIHSIRVSETGQLQYIANVDFGDEVYAVRDIAIRGDYAFVATSPNGVYILNVSQPNVPLLVGDFRSGASISALAGAGDLLFLAISSTSDVGLIEEWQVVDPLNPLLLGSFDVGEYVSGLDVWEGVTYACSEQNLLAIDFSNPSLPQLLSVVSGVGWKVAVANGIAHVYDLNDTNLIDIRNVSSPEIIGGLRYGGIDMAIGQNALFLSNNDYLATGPRQCPGEPWFEVRIDVHPGSDMNSINCKQNHGVIPVAILTTSEHDALEVDHRTVQFGPGGASEAHGKGDRVKRHEEDVDGDGDVDLLFHFRNEDAGIQCGDTEVALTGETFDGRAFRGSDTIRTVPRQHDEEGGGDRGIDLAKIASETRFHRATGCNPNPFNASTRVWYTLEESRRGSLTVYDLAGRRVARLRAGAVESAGYHEVTWRGRDDYGHNVPSGIYFYRLEAEDYVETKRMTLLK